MPDMDSSVVRLFVALLIMTVSGCDGTPIPAGHVAANIKPEVVLEAVQPPANPVPEIQPDVGSDEPQRVAHREPQPVLQTEPSAQVEKEPAQAPLRTAKQPEIVSTDQPDPETHQSHELGFRLLGQLVPPGQLQSVTWSASETFSGTVIPNAVLVVNGRKPGPVLCLTAAVHGDELNGIETVRRIIHNLNPEKLQGTLIGVPIVNMQGFQRHSRYLPDRRDLNRFFPGNPRGSSASRIAYSFFHDVVSHCDGLVDLHTGSFRRTNLPQLRADLNNPDVVALTEGFGATVILHSEGREGTLRRAAVDAGIPAVTLEAGEPMRVQDDAVQHAVKGIHTLLDTLGMYAKRRFWGNPEPTYYTSHWVRADQGGILFGAVKLGKRVKQGDVLGTVTDPITNESSSIVSPHNGRIIGMALNQFVMPGYATFHIGLEAEVDDATLEATELDFEHAVALYEIDAGEPE